MVFMMLHLVCFFCFFFSDSDAGEYGGGGSGRGRGRTSEKVEMMRREKCDDNDDGGGVARYEPRSR